MVAWQTGEPEAEILLHLGGQEAVSAPGTDALFFWGTCGWAGTRPGLLLVLQFPSQRGSCLVKQLSASLWLLEAQGCA